MPQASSLRKSSGSCFNTNAAEKSSYKSQPVKHPKSPTGKGCLRIPQKGSKSLQLTQLVPKIAQFQLLMYLFQAGFEASHRRCNLKKGVPFLGPMTCWMLCWLIVSILFGYLWFFLSRASINLPTYGGALAYPKLFVLDALFFQAIQNLEKNMSK